MKDLLIGSWINTSNPVVAEIMSASGFDFLVVDAEHAAVDVPQAQCLFQAIKAGNPSCVPMVRLPQNSYIEARRYLDAGAMGVIASLINSKTEAQKLVSSVKYPPLGERGVGYGRSHGYGFTFDEYMETANEKTLVGVQIEHIRGYENLDEILSVAGIDVAFIGPYDLTASMGITAQFDHAHYLSVRDGIIKKCREHKVAAGIHVVQPKPEEAIARINEGFKMIAYSLDITMLGNCCRLGLAKIREGLNNDIQ